MTQASIKTEINGNTLVIRLGDEFMVFPDQFAPIQSAVDSALQVDGESKIVKCVLINCQHVAHLSSVSLGKLVALQKTLTREGREMRICELNDDLKKIMEATQLDTFFSVFDDEAAAVNHNAR